MLLTYGFPCSISHVGETGEDINHLHSPGHGGFEVQYISLRSCPTHTLPPCAGAGLPHVRRCVLTASPQLWEQADQLDQAVHPPCTVQLVTAIAIPTHGEPPF